MALNTQITDCAAYITEQLNEGRAARRNVGGEGVAFGWCGGLPVTLLSFIETMQTTGLNVPVATVSKQADATKVAEGAAKPLVTQIATKDVALPKYAGYAEVTLEQIVGYANMLPAVVNVLGAQIMLALEADAVAALAASKGSTATGATWVEAVTAGQAKVLGAGGVPGLVVISADDYAAAVGEITAAAGFATDPRSPVGAFMGSALHVSPALAAGKAYVLDPSAMQAIELNTGPLILADPFSESINNKTRIVGDLFAVVTACNANHIVEVSKT